MATPFLNLVLDPCQARCLTYKFGIDVARASCPLFEQICQSIMALGGTEIFLKAARSAAFKNISRFLLSAKRCMILMCV
jgi:hypothetical protein